MKNIRNYAIRFELDNETFRSIDSVKLVIKHKDFEDPFDIPVSKRALKYKANYCYEYRVKRHKVDEPSTGL